VLTTIATRDLPDFMRHLPPNDKTKMSLSEAITYGHVIAAMDPQGGPKPRDVLRQFLSSPEMGPKLTAAGSYYMAKKSEAAPVLGLEEDRTPLPKCDPADQCGWECFVPKAAGGSSDKSSPGSDKESKSVLTIGEFVKWCIEPSLTGG